MAPPPKTVEEQLAELEMEAEAPAAPPPKSKKSAKASRSTVPAAAPPAAPTANDGEMDALRELEELEALEKREKLPPSSSSATSGSNPPRRTVGIVTPSSSAGSARTSEDRLHPGPPPPRRSGDSARSYGQTAEQPAAEPESKPAAGGSWWGGLLSTATATADAARRRAEAAYQEIQRNEEAQRWAEQVRGNVGTLRDFGGELQKRALPTFSNIIQTLAPPISQHERLQIHITHDLVGYPSLDPIIYRTFSSVMSQVEGGDLLVIQRGSESTQRRPDQDGHRPPGPGGWNDGPWWRHTEERSLGCIKGLVEGTKLARANAEAYASDFFTARGGIEEVTRRAAEATTESNPVRSSDIFLAIQAINHTTPDDLFAASATNSQGPDQAGEHKDPEELVLFAVYLHDPTHGISFHALSQSFPSRWADWIDSPANAGASGTADHLPLDIQQLIRENGVDAREWVAEWLEEAISLGVGIVAQQYVARRMGVGEGGVIQGKAPKAVVEEGLGETARAGII